MTDTSRSFCIKPWAHTFIHNNGDFALCCQSSETPQGNINTHTIREYWSSDFLKQTREQMLSGVLPDACSKCKQFEDRGLVSLRQKSNADHKIIDRYINKILTHEQLPKDMPVDIEWAMTNLCNLKCMMCNGRYSSSLLAENKILKIHEVNSKEFVIQQHSMDQMKEWIKTKPKILSFLGGESLMIPETEQLLRWGIENKLLDDTIIRIITNTTKFDQKWFDLLSQLNRLVIMVSIEGVGIVNDYIRFGSEWNKVETAVELMQQLPNADLVVHTTLQNLNVLTLDKLIDWVQEHGLLWNYEILTYPSQLQLKNLPLELLKIARSRLERHKGYSNKFRNGATILETLDAAIAEHNLDPAQWNNFFDYITLKDNHRKNSVLNVIPELVPYWHKL